MISRYLAELRALVGHRPLLMPSASAAVISGDRVLVGRLVTTGRWVLPGGAMDPGETPAQAAARETLEETGLRVTIDGLLGVWGGTPAHRTEYPNGDVVDYVMVAMRARVIGGKAQPDGHELAELAWHTVAEIRKLPRTAWMDEVLDAIEDPSRAFRPLR